MDLLRIGFGRIERGNARRDVHQGVTDVPRIRKRCLFYVTALDEFAFALPSVQFREFSTLDLGLDAALEHEGRQCFAALAAKVSIPCRSASPK
jgi:hypothetical protein